MEELFEPTCFWMTWFRTVFLLASLLAAGWIPSWAKLAQSGPTSVAEATGVTVAGQAGSAPKTPKTEKVETKEYQLSPERYAKAIAYSRAGYLIYFVSVFWEIAALILLLSSRVVAKLRDFAEEKSKSFWLQAGLFVAPLSLLLALLDLPIRMYRHHLSLQYQQSIQRWDSWFRDWSKGELLATGLGVLAAMLLLAMIRWKPKTWWLYFWAAAAPLSAFLVFVSPWVFDPMFHTFRPLGETYPELVQAIGKLTAHAGVPIPADRMFLMEASEKTNQLNAYVTGLGASKRVVVWDTLISHSNPDELLAIVGHELGHYALGHVLKGFAFGVVGMFFGLYAAYLALQWILKHWGAAWAVRGQGDWAALAVLLLIANVFSFLSEPIGNAISRMQEHAADVYSLEVIHGIVPDQAEAAAHSFQVMGEHDLADPNPPPFIKFWRYSHPPLGDRVSFAHNYDPWSKGQEPKYVK
jgi:STE24 endopeptidase